MQKFKIGHSDIVTPKISMGTWAIGGGERWGDNLEKESIATIIKAVESGVNLIDTAPGYGKEGYSEVVLGKAIKSIKRSDVYISTKCGIWWQDDEGSYLNTRDGKNIYINLSKRCVIKSLEDSLKRLQTDYVDILITHYQSRPPFDTPIEETMDALNTLKRQGKIRAIGVSNINPNQLLEYLKYGKVDIVQEKFSLLDRKAYERLGEICRNHSITFQAYSPIEQGLLTDSITLDYSPPKGNARDGKPWWEMNRRADIMKMLQSFKPLCEKYSCTMANLIIAWTAMYEKNFNVLCGARKPHQIEEIVHSGDVALEPGDWLFIKEQADNLIQIYE